MDNAEKKWDHFDSQIGLAFDLDADATLESLLKSGREAYKQALREAIEKYSIENTDNQGPMDMTFVDILTLIDTVEPTP